MLGVPFARIAALAVRRSGTILVAAAVLALLSVAAATRLRLNPEMTAFLPANNQAVSDFRRVVETLGTIDHHVVMIAVPEGADPDEYEPVVEAAAAEYAKLESVAAVEARLPAAEELAEAVLPRFVAFLRPADLDAARARLSDRAIAESMAENRMLLQTPQSGAMKELVRHDPLHLRSIFTSRLHGLGGGLALDPASRSLRSADGSTYLIVVRPSKPAQDLPFANALMREARAIEERLLHAAPSPKPRFDYAGGYAVTHADARLIRDYMIANVLFAVAGVLLLFLVAFRRWIAIVYAAVPMVLAILATYGLAAIVLGELGAASAGFAALLAGLGIDFTTVLYERYVEERNGGSSVEASLRETLHSTLPAVTIAAVTTAATFAGFLFTEFRGMAQMGFLTASGIVLFLLAVMFVFPAMLVRFERDDRPAPRTYLHAFAVSPLIRWSLRRPRATLAFWGVFVIAMSVAAREVVFTDDAGRLRARGNAGILATERLTQLFGRGGDAVMLVAEGKTADGALQSSERLLPALERLAARGEIAGFESAAAVLPSRARQEETLAAMRAGDGADFDPERIASTFRRAAASEGFRPETWNAYLALLSRGLRAREPLPPGDPLLARLTGRFLHRAGEGWMSVIYVHPPGGRWRDGAPAALRTLASTTPGVTLTGITVVSAELRRITLADARRATTIGMAIVLAILVVTLRSLLRALLVFVPFIAGMAGMLGCMALLRLELNLMNVFIGLMLVGVATDYALYMLQRHVEAPADFPSLAPRTGKAVAMAAATSMIGYGSFAFSHYPGLQSIGYAAAFGIAWSCLAALTLLPALLALRRRSN